MRTVGGEARLSQALAACPPCTREEDGACVSTGLRAQWETGMERTAERVREKIWATKVRMRAAARSRDDDGTKRVREAVGAAVKGGLGALEKRAEELRGREHVPKHVRRSWGRALAAYVQAWFDAHGRESAWRTTLVGLASVSERTRTTKLELARAGALAGVNARAWNALERDPVWLARQALEHAPKAIIEGRRDARAAWAVEHALEALGRPQRCTGAMAERALAHWRWPAVCPPLAVAHWCAEEGAALETDGEWACAMRNSPHHKTGARQLETLGVGGMCARVREEGRREAQRVCDAVVRTAAAGGTAHGDPRWTAWRARWARESALPGDGTLKAPTLEQGEDRLEWRLPLEAPEVVLFLSARTRMAPTLAASRYGAVAVGLARQVRLAHIETGSGGETLKERRRLAMERVLDAR